MSYNLKDLRRPLGAWEIDFRVQSINKGKFATILAYKDARVDMNRLDEVVGPMNWRREHCRENHNCIVSIWCPEKQVWVSKEDTGKESNTEAEKGLASDSFKRACFNWGIGRELYDYPQIQVKLRDDECELRGDRMVATWKLRIGLWDWYSEHDAEGRLTFLAGRDNHGEVRYKWGERRA